MGYIKDIRSLVGHRPIILVGAGAIIVNKAGEILLGKRADNGFWDYPAGALELGESFEVCARREVFEETGLTCGEMTYLTNLSGKEFYYEYPNGDCGYGAAVIFICHEFSGDMKVQEDEVIEQRFFSLDALPADIDPRKKCLFDKVSDYIKAKQMKNTDG